MTKKTDGHQATLRDLLALEVPTNVRVSPDGTKVAFTVQTANWKDNRYETYCYIYDDVTGVTRRLTRYGNVDQMEWMDDGTLALLKSDGEKGANMPRLKRSNPKTKHQAIKLRKASTLAETKLWSRLRNDQLGVSFRHQHAVGKYISDFCSPKARIIIELDGSQHLEHEEYDIERTSALQSQGYKVIRFWNNDVMKDIESVIRAIIFTINSESHS